MQKNNIKGKGLFQKILNFKKNFFSTFSKHADSIEQEYRIHLLVFISFIGIINLIPLGILALWEKNRPLGMADLCVALILIINLFNTMGKKKFTMNLYVGISCVALLYIYLYMTGGVNNSGFVWYFTFPLISTFLLGSTNGAVAGTLILFPVLALNIFSLPGPFFTSYSPDFQLRFIFAYVVVLLFSFLFERTRERSWDELNRIHDSLERRVEERTKELSISNLQLELGIKERKRIESDLRKSEKNYRLIAERTSDLISITTFSANPVFTYVSPSHKAVLGYESEELLGKPGFNFIHPDDKRIMIRLLTKYLKIKAKIFFARRKMEVAETIEYRARHKFGYWRHLESTVNFIGKKLLFVTKDITEKKKAEREKRELKERLVRSEKMETLGQLAGGVAHDLNNVLGAIVSYPDFILMSLPKNSKHRKTLLAMKKSGEKAVAIINDLLALTRRGVLVKKVVNLNDIAKEYLKSPEFKRLSSFHPEVKVKTALDPHLLKIDGSFIHLTKMFMNLISNAAEAMPSGGIIRIITNYRKLESRIKGHEGYISEGEYAVLKISDEGIGIDSKLLKKIFEPFYSKKVMGRSGTGLGMAVVWGSVVDHNGNIVLKTLKNKGTSFEIYFPVTESKQIRDEKKIEIKDYLGSGEKILVVDDVADQREMAVKLLTKLGYQVDTVPSGEEAIEYIKSETPDLIILDMIMSPGIDGLSTFKKLIKLKPNIKTIITSGYSETNRIKKALQLGVGQYIKKPFTLDEIGMAIRTEFEKQDM